ncbi:HNH endonuclease [Halorubrum sp. CSM-61]|uniref:HNH endonuclease n=1 Tax=Halorubrum sp. CSM-61 TaxID=2485838 RepID=UPI0037429DE9
MKAHHALIHAESIAESRSLGKSTRQTVLDRDDNRCQRCNIKVAAGSENGAGFQLHHIVPFSAGGPNHPDNLVTLCNDCHTLAHQQMKNLVEEHTELLDELRTIVCDTK